MIIQNTITALYFGWAFFALFAVWLWGWRIRPGLLDLPNGRDLVHFVDPVCGLLAVGGLIRFYWYLTRMAGLDEVPARLGSPPLLLLVLAFWGLAFYAAYRSHPWVGRAWVVAPTVMVAGALWSAMILFTEVGDLMR